MVARRPWRALRRDRRGAYALEFALVLNALMIVLLLTLEVAFQFTIDVALDNGARQASRQATLGSGVANPITTSTDLLNNVLTRTGLPLQAWADSSSISAEVFTSYAALAAAGNLPGGNACPASANTGVGASGNIMRYCIRYVSRIFTPYGKLMLPSSLAVHRTFFVVQNEPY